MAVSPGESCCNETAVERATWLWAAIHTCNCWPNTPGLPTGGRGQPVASRGERSRVALGKPSIRQRHVPRPSMVRWTILMISRQPSRKGGEDFSLGISRMQNSIR